MFYIAEEDLVRLERVMKRLFTEERMNGDDMRDAAQVIENVVRTTRGFPAPDPSE